MNPDLPQRRRSARKSTHEELVAASEAVEQELNVVKALKRLSIGNALSYDPDLPPDESELASLSGYNGYLDLQRNVTRSSSSSSSSRYRRSSLRETQIAEPDEPESYISQKSEKTPESTRLPVSSQKVQPQKLQRRQRRSMDTQQEVSSEKNVGQADEPVKLPPADNSDGSGEYGPRNVIVDSSRLMWVPAAAHPKLAPEKFRAYVQDTVQEITQKLDRSRSKRRSMLSVESDGDDGARKGRISDSGRGSTGGTTATDLTRHSSASSHSPASLSPQPSLKELTRELESLSHLAGMDSTDAVTLARTLSSSSLGFTSTEKQIYGSGDSSNSTDSDKPLALPEAAPVDENLPIPTGGGGGLRRARWTTYRKNSRPSIRRMRNGKYRIERAETEPAQPIQHTEHVGRTTAPPHSPESLPQAPTSSASATPPVPASIPPPAAAAPVNEDESRRGWKWLKSRTVAEGQENNYEKVAPHSNSESEEPDDKKATFANLFRFHGHEDDSKMQHSKPTHLESSPSPAQTMLPTHSQPPPASAPPIETHHTAFTELKAVFGSRRHHHHSNDNTPGSSDSQGSHVSESTVGRSPEPSTSHSFQRIERVRPNSHSGGQKVEVPAHESMRATSPVMAPPTRQAPVMRERGRAPADMNRRQLEYYDRINGTHHSRDVHQQEEVVGRAGPVRHHHHHQPSHRDVRLPSGGKVGSNSGGIVGGNPRRQVSGHRHASGHHVSGKPPNVSSRRRVPHDTFSRRQQGPALPLPAAPGEPAGNRRQQEYQMQMLQRERAQLARSARHGRHHRGLKGENTGSVQGANQVYRSAESEESYRGHPGGRVKRERKRNEDIRRQRNPHEHSSHPEAGNTRNRERRNEGNRQEPSRHPGQMSNQAPDRPSTAPAPVQQSVNQVRSVQTSIQNPVQDPVQAPVQAPVQRPIQKPAQASSDQPVSANQIASVNHMSNQPSNQPVGAPVNQPANQMAGQPDHPATQPVTLLANQPSGAGSPTSQPSSPMPMVPEPSTEDLKRSLKVARRDTKPNQPLEMRDSAFGFPLPPVSKSTLIMLDYRFPIHVERAVYRLSHLKLADPKRPLYQQVLLSNFMYAYLNLVNHTLYLQQQQQEQIYHQQQMRVQRESTSPTSPTSQAPTSPTSPGNNNNYGGYIEQAY